MNLRDRYLDAIAVLDRPGTVETGHIVRVQTSPGHRAGDIEYIDDLPGRDRCRGMTHQVSYRLDRITMSVPSRCLFSGAPRELGVGLTTRIVSKADQSRVDHLPNNFRFIQVRRG